MKLNFAIILICLIASSISGLAADRPDENGQESVHVDSVLMRKALCAGVGIGLPYGVIGTKLAWNLINYLSVSLGCGTTGKSIATVVGISCYPFGISSMYSPKIELLKGTIGNIENTSENVSGYALGYGVRINYERTNYYMEMGVLYSFYENYLPANYTSNDKNSTFNI